MIELDNITKIYRMGKVEVPALRGITLTIQQGEMVALIGASGSGKSTLMNILGFLDKPTIGKYLLDGIDVSKLRDDKLVYSGTLTQRRKRCLEALERVGLGDRVHHKPTELSGGEQQRVAIARALVNNPTLILADEPTGNLDTASSQEIISIFCRLNQEGITILLVTHEMDIANQAKRIIRLRDGRIMSDEAVKRDEKSICERVSKENQKNSEAKGGQA